MGSIYERFSIKNTPEKKISLNQQQELPVAAMFINGSDQHLQ
jgi:hypothetical protein